MKPGISLLEVMVGLAIGSMITVLLYQSLTQTTRVVKTVDAFIDVHSELSLAQNRLMRDFSGAYVPLLEQAAQEEKSDDGKIEKPKVQQEKSHDIFVLKSTDGEKSLLRSCTFITSNPLYTYGENPERRVRIVYTLEKSTNDNTLFVLKRFESPIVNYAKFQELQKANSIKGYEVLENIRQLSIEVKARQPQKESEDGQSAPVTYENFSAWSDDEKRKDKKSILPEFVEIKGSIVDGRKKREVAFTYIVPIAAWNAMPKKPSQKPPQRPKPSLGKLEEVFKNAGVSFAKPKNNKPGDIDMNMGAARA